MWFEDGCHVAFWHLLGSAKGIMWVLRLNCATNELVVVKIWNTSVMLGHYVGVIVPVTIIVR